MQLSIIIVNYNSKHYIADCINSACAFKSYQDFEWIVVDNKSADDSKNFLLSKFPFIKWIEMNYNAGFARANNAGIKQAKGEIILLLNPDTIIINDCIEKCRQKFIIDSAIVCAPQLINKDGSMQITGNYFMRGGLNQLLPLPYLGKLLRKIAFAFKVKKTNVLSASVYQKVDWINGAFLMVKKSAILKAGLMDEEFFLYAEESEWCSRLKKIGDLVVYGDLKLIHAQGEIINSEAKSFDKGYFNLYDKKGLQLIISNCLRIRKQYGTAWFILHLIIYVTEIPIFILGNFINNLFHFKNPFRNWHLINGFVKNVFTLLKLSPVIIAKKKFFYKML